MSTTQQEIQAAIRTLGLAGQCVCLHSSLRSFGHVAGGAPSVVRAFLAEGCTLLVPTFSSAFEIAPPPHLRFARNGWDYATMTKPSATVSYAPDMSEIDRYMGAIPTAVLAWPERRRGAHQLDSFTAVGPHAAELISGQAPLAVYAPLEALIGLGGYVVLAGVGLERMTLLHLAEQAAGRTLFRRWALDGRGQASAVEVGGCSEGFGRLAPHLRTLKRTTLVGQSAWQIFPAREALTRAAAAIRADPSITLCEDETCERCNDAVAGGPILN